MCSYLHKAPNGVYYFRMVIPVVLRPYIGGKREIKMSLGLKDREAAKLLIPDHTKAAHALIEQAKREKAVADVPALKVVRPKSPVQINRERAQWEFDEDQVAMASDAAFFDDMEIEELEPIMDALAAGREPEGTLSEIARAGKLLVQHEREKADADKQSLIAKMYARYGENGRASEVHYQAIESESNPHPSGPGKGIYLDTDIVDGWAAERKPSPRGKDAYWRDAKLFNSMMGRKSVEQITKADVMAYKRLLIADPLRSQINVRDRLAYLRTLLEWAAQEDVIPGNPARDVKMAVSERGSKRADFNTDDLNALFAGPVHAKGERPKGGCGEAAYWLPLIALFMGARREEIGQLRVDDVKCVPYIDEADQRQEVWCIDITDTPDDDALPNQLKNESSNRLVPLHPKLIELGFVEYVKSLPNQAGRVFPDLKPVGIGQKLTDKWGQWFSRYKVACGITDRTKVFHSFRHNWKTHATDVGIQERICRQFQGHEGREAADRYGATPSMPALVAAVASYRVPGLTIPAPALD